MNLEEYIPIATHNKHVLVYSKIFPISTADVCADGTVGKIG
jgi:hypothetical protein